MTIGLERILNSHIDGCSYASLRDRYLQDTNNNYIAYLTVDVSDKTKINCPLCILRLVFEKLRAYSEHDCNLTEIVVPLQHKARYGATVTTKSVDSALKAVFENTELGSIRKAILGDDFIYGTMGLILDSEFKPMMMTTVEFDFTTKTFDNYTVTISPNTYSSKNKIAKGIINKLIPYYLEKSMYTDFYTNSTAKDLKPIVTFKPISCYKTNYNQHTYSVLDPNTMLLLSRHTLELSL